MSRSRRFYVPELARSSVSLPREEAHHAIHVLRLGAGDEVELFDGRGRVVRGRITDATGSSVTVESTEELASAESSLDLTIALAVPKPDRMAFAVQKLTELGVWRIIPLVAARSLRTPRKDSQIERWRRIVLEATKQSGRSRLAEVTPEKKIADILGGSPRARVLMAHRGAPPLSALELAPETPIVTLIGPEGGWTDEEVELGRENDARAFGMGPRILRTETAALAAATLLQSRLGDG